MSSRIKYQFTLLFKDGHWEDHTVTLEDTPPFANEEEARQYYLTNHWVSSDNGGNILSVIPRGRVKGGEDVDIPGTHRRLKCPNLYCIRFTEEFETYIEAYSEDEAVERFEDETIAGIEEKRKYIRAEIECIDDVEELASVSSDNLKEDVIHRLGYPDKEAMLEQLMQHRAAEAMDDPKYNLEGYIYEVIADRFREVPIESVLEALKQEYPEAHKEMLHAVWREYRKEHDEQED